MKIILSPAKKMVTDTDSIAPVGMPDFLDKTTKILSWMKSLEKEELKAIWKCNDKIARQNFDRLENMDLYHMLTPAILSYEGIAFQYMAPAVFEDGQFEYIQKHLRILSAFYGSLKPLDGVKPYRLEMQAKVTIGNTRNLYDYWGDLLYQSVIDDSRIIINLASKEWSDLWQKEGLKIQLIYKNLTDWAIGLEKTCHQRRNIFLNGCLHCSVVLHTNKTT